MSSTRLFLNTTFIQAGFCALPLEDRQKQAITSYPLDAGGRITSQPNNSPTES